MGNPIIDPHRELRSPPIDAKPEYAIAGSWLEYHNWKRQHPELGIISYLTKERAEILLAKGAPRGVLHRAPGWETSDARELAERLEDST